MNAADSNQASADAIPTVDVSTLSEGPASSGERSGEWSCVRPLRVGFLTLDWPPTSGGMARYCYETAVALAERGHFVTVLAGRRAEAGNHPRIRVIPGLIGDLSHDDRLLRAHDAEVDLWHGWEFGFAGLAAATDRPMFVTVHGNDLFSPKVYYRFAHTPLLHRFAARMARPRWQARMCADGLRRVAAFLPNSRATARLLTGNYAITRPVRIMPCGVGDDFFQQHAPPLPPTRLLTVCTLTAQRPRKNADGVLRALAMLGDTYKWHYDVAGGGDLVDATRALATELGLANRVTIHGAVDDARLKQLYAAADLFILAPRPAAEDVEGFGIVYLEANASGTPVLATRVGGVVDAVRDGVSGFFADSAEPQDLALALHQYLSGRIRFDGGAVRGWAERHRYRFLAGRLEVAYRSAESGGTRGGIFPHSPRLVFGRSPLPQPRGSDRVTALIGRLRL